MSARRPHLPRYLHTGYSHGVRPTPLRLGQRRGSALREARLFKRENYLLAGPDLLLPLLRETLADLLAELAVSNEGVTRFIRTDSGLENLIDRARLVLKATEESLQRTTRARPQRLE